MIDTIKVMEGISKQTLLHAGVELVVVGGLTLWFSKKTSLLQEQIIMLEERIAQYEKAMANYENVLMAHDQLLRAMTGQAAYPPAHRSPAQREGPPPREQPQQPSTVPLQEPEEEDIDSLIQSELQEIESERHHVVSVDLNGEDASSNHSPGDLKKST